MEISKLSGTTHVLFGLQNSVASANLRLANQKRGHCANELVGGIELAIHRLP